MARFWLATAALAGTTLLGGAGRAAAQYPNPYSGPPNININQPSGPSPLLQPNVSPYLGLLRTNGNGNNLNNSGLALRYYNIVQPDVRTQNNLQQQQLEQDRLARQQQLLQQQQQQTLLNPFTQPGADARSGASRTMRPTGHPTSVMNFGGRHMTR